MGLMYVSQYHNLYLQMKKKLKCSKECSGVKVQNSDLSFSEVELLEIGNTQVKYKCLKTELKYSTKVNVLSYFTPLAETVI